MIGSGGNPAVNCRRLIVADEAIAMRLALTSTLIVLMMGAAGLQAQVYARGSYENGRFTAEFGHNAQERGPALLDRVRRDVDRAESESVQMASGGDHKRFNKVRGELGEFEGKLASGRFDKHELDDTIKNLQRVVNDNRMEYRDRDVLARDLAELREFRGRY
jgi:hypothetical protein